MDTPIAVLLWFVMVIAPLYMLHRLKVTIFSVCPFCFLRNTLNSVAFRYIRIFAYKKGIGPEFDQYMEDVRNKALGFPTRTEFLQEESDGNLSGMQQGDGEVGNQKEGDVRSET